MNETLTWAEKQLRSTEINLARAVNRNSNSQEVQSLQTKVNHWNNIVNTLKNSIDI